MYSIEHKKYLRKRKRKKVIILSLQILIVLSLLFLWEMLARYNLINVFITSSPSLIFKTIISLYKDNNLFNNIFITIYETLLSFSLSTILGILIASILWNYNTLYKVLDPFLTLLNSLPKVALGPIIIIYFGANLNSIIIMSLLISLIITIVNVYNGFIKTDTNKIKLLNSFGANKYKIYKLLILPNSYPEIISSMKINISMSLIGVIMGEFLVSKQGIGYIIMYGSQVFNLNLVMSGIIILMIVSIIMYKIINSIEKRLIKNN